MGQRAEKDNFGGIKEQAGQDMIILLQGWKKRARRLKIYRFGLCLALLLSCTALAWALYYQIDSSIPSVLNVRADQEESFYFGVPAEAEIISVSESGESNIPVGSIDIDLSKTVTMRTAQEASYRAQVKLFGFLPIKQMDIQVIADQELIPVGAPIGIYVKTEGVLVVGTGEFTGADGAVYAPSRYILKSGDYIRKVNGKAVTEKEDFIQYIEACGGRQVILSLERDDEIMEVRVNPVKDRNGSYKIGVWVRDNAQGVGTMTYIDSQGNFGALGHGINDIDTSTLMQMEDGTLYQTNIVDIKKGTNGDPGEMTGMIVYADENILGSITSNSEKGIFGHCNDRAMELAVQDPLPIGLKQEIVKGPAKILCSVDGTAKYYDVEITAVHLDHDNVNRGIELTVTDKELLDLTGGIVQGMSGSPIIQNGKIIGAVTHVLVQNSAKGFGIFIESMLDH